jgi:hypothetical protein
MCSIDLENRKGGMGLMTKSLPQSKTRKRTSRPIRKSNKADAARPTPLNFKVPANFRREFKTYAAQHNKKLNQLLYEAFAALKAKHVH